MEHLDGRKKAILYYLAENNKVITSDQLSKITGVTSRTVKKDVNDLNGIIKNHGALIEARLGKGYYLVIINEFEFNKYLLSQRGYDNNIIKDTPNYRYERINYIIKKLLAIDYFIRLEYLSDELCVSRSTLAKDFKEVREILSEYNLLIISKPNYGVLLDGDEINKRLCISEYYFHSDLTTGFFAADHAMFVSESNQQEIMDINKILTEVTQEFNLNISDLSLQNLVIHIVISIRRWRFYNYVKIAEDSVAKIENFREFPAGLKLKDELEKYSNMILPIDEAYYFALHLHSKHVNEISELDKDEITKIDGVLDKIYSVFEKKYQLKIENKCDFEQFIKLHISLMVERLSLNMSIRNPQAYKILFDYPLAVHITYDVVKIIEKEFNIKMNVNEFSYLVLYTNLIIRNLHNSNYRILIACFQGRPEMITMLNELNENLSGIVNQIELCDYNMLDSKNLDNFDLLITTVPMTKQLDIPVIEISDTIPYWQQIANSIEVYNYNESGIRKALKQKYFLKNVTASNREDILMKISSSFNDAASVYEKLIKAEQKISAETTNNIAYLHTIDPIDEDFILICTLKKPIIWKKQWIQLIIWVNCKDQNIRKLNSYYKFVKRLVDTEGITERILNIEKAEDLFDYVDSNHR